MFTSDALPPVHCPEKFDEQCSSSNVHEQVELAERNELSGVHVKSSRRNREDNSLVKRTLIRNASTTNPLIVTMLPRLTDQQRACAEALQLDGSIVRTRRLRKWSAWEAVATPARDRGFDGCRGFRVRYGQPRCWSEAYRSMAASRIRRQQIITARAMLVERGLLPREIADALPIERARHIPYQPQTSRKRRRYPTMRVSRRAYHRPLD
jgi:hypothetical protein